MNDELILLENKLTNNRELKKNNKILKKTECGKITNSLKNTQNILRWVE